MSVHHLRISKPWNWHGVEFHARRETWLDAIANDERLSDEHLGAARLLLRTIDRMSWSDQDQSIELPLGAYPAIKTLTCYGYLTDMWILR